MKLIKCDRCGKIFDEESRSQITNWRISEENYTIMNVDLCQKCATEAKNFMTYNNRGER